MFRYPEILLNNRISPFLVDGLLARSLTNLVSDSPGHLAKRRGINLAVTVGLRIGAAPYNIFQWIYTGGGGGTTLVAVGADAIAIFNPLNSYLYTRTSAGADGIWSQPGGAADIAASWGLGAPTGAFTTTHPVGLSMLDGGVYAYAACGYDATRRVYGPPVFGTCTDVGAVDKWQWIGYPSWYVDAVLPTRPAGASHIRLFRERLQAISPSTGWLRVQASRWGISGMRLVAEQAAGTVSDYGGQALGEILTFAHTVVPYGGAYGVFDGRWFYGSGLNLYYSNPGCPETYAANTTVQGAPLTPTLAATDDGLVTGEARILLQPNAGNLVALAFCAEQGLALCQFGSWSLIRLGDGVSYGAAQDMLSVGCASRATVCHTPYGVFWLAPDGIALWTGQGAPAVLTRDWLDLYGTEIGAATDLTGAMAAYDFKRNRYVCAIPKEAGGFAIVVIHADRLESSQVSIRFWTLAHTDTLVGMGWDPTTAEVVFYFYNATGPVYTAQVARDSSYRDVDQTTGTVVSIGLDLILNGGDREVIRNPTLVVVPYRASVAAAQSLSVTMRGMPIEDYSSGTARSATALSWAIDERTSKPVSLGVSGKLIRFTLAQADAYPFDIMELQVGEADEAVKGRNG